MRDLSSEEFDWTSETIGSFETASVIDRHTAVEGNVRSQRDLRVEGELKGTVACEGTFFVAEGATVTASIDAEHVTVAGDVNGEVRCRGRLQILPSGRVRAKVSTSALVIQEGALYDGQLEMAGLERSGPRPLRARPASGPVNLDTSGGERAASGGTTFIRRLGGPEAPWEAANAESSGSAGEDEPDAEGPAS